MIYENGKQVYDIFNGDIFEVEGEHSGEEFICVSTMQTNNGNFRAKDRNGRLFWFNTVTDTIYILERLKDASRKVLKKESNRFQENICESTGINLRFEKSQPDQYFIYNGSEEVGYFYCRDYYSRPNHRIWTVVVNIGAYQSTDNAYTVKEAKDIAKNMYAKMLDHLGTDTDVSESYGVRKLHISEMTSDEQREKVKQLKVEIRDMMQQIDFERIPEATMAMYETDTKGFRESLIEWAIHCDGDMGHWTTEKIYVGSLEGKSPILYKFNRALSVVMLTTGNGSIVNIAKSGQTRIDPPWTKLDALERLHDWLSEYLAQ